jgi:TolA-binding protein
MKKLLLSMTALATLATGVAATPAAAQRWQQNDRSYGNWQSINQRQANLYQRIEMGVRNGSLTRVEASTLRGRFVAINNLEQRYRRNGLTQWERRDLDQRFNALSQQIRSQRHDRQDRDGRHDRDWRR